MSSAKSPPFCLGLNVLKILPLWIVWGSYQEILCYVFMFYNMWFMLFPASLLCTLVAVMKLMQNIYLWIFTHGAFHLAAIAGVTVLVHLCSSFEDQGAVSRTFRELPKTFSQKYTTPEITFMVRISIWKFVRVPKARLWAHVQSFSLKFSSNVLFVQYTNFERSFWRARETLVAPVWLADINSLVPGKFEWNI